MRVELLHYYLPVEFIKHEMSSVRAKPNAEGIFAKCGSLEWNSNIRRVHMANSWII